MPVRDVESIDLATVTDDNAITFHGTMEDGRRINLSVDFFKAVGGFAYGAILATEQTEVDSPTSRMNHDLSTLFARVPLSGSVEGGTYELEVSTETSSLIDGIPADSELAQASWTTLPVVYDRLELVDRSEAAIRQAALDLLKADEALDDDVFTPPPA